MAGCRGSYRVIQSLDECVAAKAAVEPSFGGVQTGGFGQEWANGCFYNSGTVYFHTDGDVRAHTDAQSYRVNGGWSASHEALCAWSSLAPASTLAPTQRPPCREGAARDACSVCGGDGTSCVPHAVASNSVVFDMPGCEIRLSFVLDVASNISIVLSQKSAPKAPNAFVVWVDGVRQGLGLHNATFSTAAATDEAAYDYQLLRRRDGSVSSVPLLPGVHTVRVLKARPSNCAEWAQAPLPALFYRPQTFKVTGFIDDLVC